MVKKVVVENCRQAQVHTSCVNIFFLASNKFILYFDEKQFQWQDYEYQKEKVERNCDDPRTFEAFTGIL